MFDKYYALRKGRMRTYSILGIDFLGFTIIGIFCPILEEPQRHSCQTDEKAQCTTEDEQRYETPQANARSLAPDRATEIGP